MKTVTKKFGETEVEYVKLTYDEELDMAKWFMETLCLPWIETREEFHQLLRLLYFRKCSGRNFEAWHMVELYEKYQHYIQYEDLGLALIPVFEEDDNYRRHRYPLKKGVIRAWREAWEMNSLFRKRVDFGEIFPDGTTVEGYEEEQHKIEEEFWNRVEEVQKEYGCNKDQAIREVSDYMSRGKV